MEPIRFESQVPIILCSDNAIDFDGYTAGLDGRNSFRFTPDESKGYIQFQVAHAFPSIIDAFGLGMMPQVIHASFKSMLNQNVNLEHKLKAFAKDEDKANTDDRFLGGCVVAVDFPSQPIGGWTIGKGAPPAIKGVMSFAKLATPIRKIVGDHMTGRHEYTVSMETAWPLEEAGFAVATDGQHSEFKDTTPGGMFDGSPWEYVPWDQAPADMKRMFSEDKRRMTSTKYSSAAGKNRNTVLLMGGLNNPVHFSGIGLVKYGAEKAAKIQRMAATGTVDIVSPFQKLAAILKKASQK